MTIEYDEAALQAVREGRLLINQYDTWLFDEFRPYIGERVFEIGCGLGNQLVHFLDRQQYVGIDVSDESVTSLQRQFASYSNIRAYTMSVVDPKVLQLKKYAFDTAISLNVLEHIQDDRLALRNTFDVLAPGGRLLLAIPAHMWLFGEMDRSIGHYRRYTLASLQEKLEEAGFQVIQQKYVNTLGALGWWFNGRVLHKRVPPSDQLRLFNILVRFVRIYEHVIPAPFGISVFSVSQKPG